METCYGKRKSNVEGDFIMSLELSEEKISRALDIILEYGGCDGGHHKQWVLDQVVQILTGDFYEDWLKLYEVGKDGPKTYEWDKGIAP